MTTILIIEDNKENLNLMTYLLSKHGYTVLSAMDGVQGLQISSQEKCDLIICDMQLPLVDGMEVIRTLKAQNNPLNTLPIIAITAYAMVGDKERIMLSGCDGYIAKPIQPEIFISQLEAFLPVEKHAYLTQSIWLKNSSPNIDKKANYSRGNILVVDDNPADRYLSEVLLRSIGFTSLLASTVEEAIALLQNSKPDFILSDYHLQDKNGTDLLEYVRNNEDLKEIPFVMISSSLASEAYRKMQNKYSLEEIIIRPIEPQVFLGIIENIWSKNKVHGVIG